MAYQPLDCSLYDIVEVLCMRGYDILIETTEDELLQAKALTTRTSSTEGEFIQVESSQALREIRLDMIVAITVVTEGSGFDRIEFGSNSCAIP